jgi:hypothetical protein
MKTIQILFFSVSLVLLQSCMMTKTPVGTYIETPGKEYTYDKGKQMWLFFGLIPLGRTNVNTPSDGNCQIITKYRFTDVLITGLTAGIVSSYSIKVVAKKPETDSK